MLVIASHAKELELVVQSQANQPMDISYQFFGGDHHIYAQGDINNMNANRKYYIYVNRVPDKKDILIKISKMSIDNVSVFNDPCEIKLSKNQKFAQINVGFKGNPDPEERDGAFICHVSKYKNN